MSKSKKFDKHVEEAKEIGIRRFRVRVFWWTIILIGSSSYKTGRIKFVSQETAGIEV